MEALKVAWSFGNFNHVNPTEMKKLLLLTLTVLTFGCKNDPVDIRDNATGRYTGNATFYLKMRNGVLVQPGMVTADSLNVSKASATDKIIIDFGDGDLAIGTHLQTSPKGFTFDLDPIVGSGFQFIGYAAYLSDGRYYDGGFSKAGSKLELWYESTFNDTVKVVKCTMAKQ
jgi:hypothetical protein